MRRTLRPVASILIPTWDSAATLPLAVGSAIRQTVADIEILIVGDGVTPRARAVIESLVKLDDRVRFLDLPKAPGRGERNRHKGVLACRSDLVVYLADDDLLLPWHVEQIAEAFRTADFVQSLNCYLDADDRLRLWPTDLADPERRKWHLHTPPRNRVSITGTAHSRELYLTLDPGWCEPEPGSWADLALWQQFFRRAELRATTLRGISAVQWPAPLHRDRPVEELAASYARWEAIARSPEARALVARLQEDTQWAELVRFSEEATDRMIMWQETARAQSAAKSELSWPATEIEELRASRLRRTTALMRAISASIRRLGTGRG